jgi:APA family basic amino acid/polyamine antiporter
MESNRTIDTRSTGTDGKPFGFHRRFGLFDAAMLVVGAMSGSGIFIVSAEIARDVGSSGWLMLVWVVTGVVAITGALSYAELAAMMPHAGGPYLYLREAYGPRLGFLYGWAGFLVVQTGSIAAVAIAFARFLGVLVPEWGTQAILYEVDGLDIKIAFTPPWMTEPVTFFERQELAVSAGQLVAVAVIALLTLVNCRGVREGKVVQNVFSVATMAGLVLLIIAGLTIAVDFSAVAENTRDIWGGLSRTSRFQEVLSFARVPALAIVLIVSGAMVGPLFSANAWSNITLVAGEMSNPRRNLPWSLVLGAGIAIVLYLFANLTYLAALPTRGDPAKATRLRDAANTHEQHALRVRENGGHDDARALARIADEFRKEAVSARGIDHAGDDRVATAVLQRVSPSLGAPLMAVAIMISAFGCVNGLILMGARLYYAMARDGLFFQAVGRLNRRGVPAAGLIVQGIWSSLLVFSGRPDELLGHVVFVGLIFHVLAVTGLFVLRRKAPHFERPYRAVGYPFIPALCVLLCALIALSLLVDKPASSWPSLLLVLTGIPVYWLWVRKSRRPPLATH